MKVTLKNVRIAFADGVFSAKSSEQGGEPKFGASFLFAPGSEPHKTVSAAINQVATEKWGAKGPEQVKALAATDKLCVHDGDIKPQYAGYPGNKYVSANNKTRPQVRDRDTSPLIAADGKPYSGCYVNAIIDVWAQDNRFGKRINAALLGVQFVADGEQFSGGGVASDDDFEVVEGSATSATADDLV